MTATESTHRGRARIAEPGEGIGLDELALATRNHGMPLEALRYDVTPPGLHYVLTHYDIPAVDPATWSLQVGGAVDRPLRLTLEDLQRRPAVTSRVLLECAGNGRARYEPRPVSQPWLLEAVGTAEWTGTPLGPLLEEAGIADGAVDVVFTGADHGVERGVEQDYARGLPLAEAMRPEVLLVWAMNGVPLPPQHGAPLRLLVPGWPDFMTRERFLRPGPVTLTGRAWSGRAPVTGVEVSTDGGATWSPAELAPADPEHPFAWRAWQYPWTAEPGTWELVVRATDAEGGQPTEQVWNRQGMANNLVQRVPVTVLE
jgi:DMSO/TMAO reductase YedYZ molybdopterin-dependent catalytic subunit